MSPFTKQEQNKQIEDLRERGHFFKALGHVEQWAETHGGELGVRNALAGGRFMPGIPSKLASEWLSECERKRADALNNTAINLALRATEAAEKSAQYTMWTAILSATVGIVTAAAYYVSR